LEETDFHPEEAIIDVKDPEGKRELPDYSGGPGDRLAGRIGEMDIDQLTKLQDELDRIAMGPVKPATFSRRRLAGLRGQITSRVQELRTQERGG
jgi:hypothetical protein